MKTEMHGASLFTSDVNQYGIHKHSNYRPKIPK